MPPPKTAAVKGTVKVMNNEARVHTLGIGYSVTAGGAGRQAKSVRLLPGLNEVLASSWEAAKQNPVVQSLIRKGVFREVQLKQGSGIAQLSVADAVALVEKTLDRELLRSWKKLDTRSTVLEAIEKQIDHVTYQPDRDAPTADGEGFDLQPRQAATGFDATDVATQVQQGLPPVPEEEKLEPVFADPADRGSKAPVEPPAALTSQLKDVEEPRTTPPARPRAHEEKPKGDHSKGHASRPGAHSAAHPKKGK